MGKGQRSREARVGKREELKKIAAKKKLRSKIYKIVGAAAAAVAVVAIVGIVIYNTIASTGYFLRNTVAMKTDNYQVDNAMMTYYVKNQYYSFVNQYGDYLSMYGLDTSKSLKSQEYGDGTWFDYFLGLAEDQAKETLLCAEKAKADGYELSDEDKQTIDDAIASFETEAETYGITMESYYNQVFGTGIKEDDVRRAMELTQLASNYYDDYIASLTYTDEDLQNYFNKNESDFVKADYIKYTVPGETDEDKKANANELMNAATTDELITILEKKYTDEQKQAAIEENINEGMTEEEAQNLTEEDLTTIAESVQSSIDALEYTSYKPEEASEDTGLTWVFEEGRAVGDKHLEETDATDDTAYSCTLYVVKKPAYFDNYNVKKVRHIMFTETTYGTSEDAKAKAEEVLELYKADATENKFIELAKEYSEDSSTAENGGLYEQVSKDTSNWPENFSNWCYADGRAAGDVEMIETDSGWHIMYYVGEGDLLWKETARTAMKSDDYEAHLTELEETYAPVISEGKMQSIKA